MAANWNTRSIPFTIDTYDSDSAYDADEMYDGLSLTTYSGRVVPTTNYNNRTVFIILREDGSALLREDGTFFLREGSGIQTSWSGRIIP